MNKQQQLALETCIAQSLQEKNWQQVLEIALFGKEKEIPGYEQEFRFFLRKEFSQEETKDVFSQFVQNLCAGIPNFRKDSSFRTWAYVILRHTIYQYQKNKSRKEIATVRIQKSSQASSNNSPNPRYIISESKLKFDGSSPSSLLRSQEQKELLNELIQTLKPWEQELLYLVAGKGMTYEASAVTLSKTLGKEISTFAARQRYVRIQQKLKKLAQDKGYILDEDL